MQLVKVYSNHDSFRTVNFNIDKPNFIIAKQKKPGSSEEGKTYNGVGKSLLVRIIHFCLGASIKEYRVFCDKLPGWEFSLDFKIGVRNLSVSRVTNEPSKITFDGEHIGLDKFKKEMEKLCFSIPDETGFVSFRSLVPFFIRPKKESYVECKKPGKTGSEYQTLLYNSFLLGLDINLAEKKYKLRKEQERIRNLEKNFRDDSLLRDYFTGDKDVSLALVDLEEKIGKIENDLEIFKVADDYHEIQIEADAVEKELFELNNDITIISNNIDNLEKSLNINPSMKSSEIESVYAEAKVLFPETIKKTLSEVDDFYSKLISNRIRRLSEQKNHFDLLKKQKLEDSSNLKIKLDALMGYLGEHQALDLFISLSKKVADIKSQKENLEKYQVLQSGYKSKERQTEKDMIDLSEITDSYLTKIEESTGEIRDFFRSLAKTFYPQSVAGLTINTNEGENQLVFDIEPKIESDGSDGISNVKLFCYDLSILFKGHNHNMDFIFHDSRLYDGIDERQKASMFKIIGEFFSGSEKQYISTVNQNQLNEIKANLTPAEYTSIIEDNTILTLTDDNDNEKLLGIKVDIGNK